MNLPQQNLSSTTGIKTTIAPKIENNDPSASARNLMESIRAYTLCDILFLEQEALKLEASEDNVVSPSDAGLRRCTTALASLCFAVLEQLGLILSLDSKDVLASESCKKFVNYFTFATGGNWLSLPEAEAICIYRCFRNKISHNLYPMYGMGICQNKSNPIDRIIVEQDGIFSLNVNFLTALTISAIRNLSDLIANPRESDIMKVITRNLQILEDADKEKLKNHYEKTLPKKDPKKDILKQWFPGIDQH